MVGVVLFVFQIHPPSLTAGQEVYLPAGPALRGVGLIGEASNFALLSLLVFAVAAYVHHEVPLTFATRVMAGFAGVLGVLVSFSREVAVGVLLLIFLHGVLQRSYRKTLLLAAAVAAAAPAA